MRNPSLWLFGGIAGVVCVSSYFIAVAVPWPENQLGTSGLLIVISAFPIMGIIYAYALYSFVAAERESAVNRLGLVFAITAYTTLLSMIVVQLAVNAGVAEIASGLDAQSARALRRGLRMIDLGLDVAWDILIGTALVLTGLAMRRRSGLGSGWGLPSIGFGIALIVLNAVTFPWPPATRGLFDIGPFIAIFMLALGGRLALLGSRELRSVNGLAADTAR